MAVTKTAAALLVVGLIVGVGIGYGIGFMYQPPTEKESVSGTWKYTPIDPFPIHTKEVGDYTFLLGEDEGVWTGTFDGTSDEDFIVMMHNPSGFRYYKGLIAFTGIVKGKSGNLVIGTVGKWPPSTEEWSGEWVILSGTGDLENLRGQGTFWRPPLDLDYSGRIHFEDEA